MPAKTKDVLYQLKVTLIGSEPRIWRRIIVPAEVTLDELHDILQVAMGWTNSHLHQFIVQSAPKPTHKEMDERRRHAAIHDLDVDMDEIEGITRYSMPDFQLEFAGDETDVRLRDVAPTEKSRFVYEYDFGDGWQHDIRVEKIRPRKRGETFIQCIAGKYAGPPEDCGGVWGYADLLEILADEEHERHEEMLDWLGGELDPDHFDPEEANAVYRTWAKEMR